MLELGVWINAVEVSIDPSGLIELYVEARFHILFLLSLKAGM